MSVHDSPARNLAAFGYGCLAFLAIVSAVTGTTFAVAMSFVDFSEEEFTNDKGFAVLAVLLAIFVSVIIGIIVGNNFGKLMMRKMRTSRYNYSAPGTVVGFAAALAIAGIIGLIILAIIAIYFFFFVIVGYVVLFLLIGATTR